MVMADKSLDKFYHIPIGRLDKPFHRPECRCERCEQWVREHYQKPHLERKARKS